MQTALCQFVRLSRHVSGWCRGLWPRTDPAAFQRTGVHFASAGKPLPSRAGASALAHANTDRTRETRSIVIPAAPAATAPAARAPVAPTRAVRVHRAGAGSGERLALVGRMSDVCAELDRLASRERRCA